MSDDEVPQLEVADVSAGNFEHKDSKAAAGAGARPGAESEAGPSKTTQASQTNSLDPYERRKVPLTLLTGYLGAGKSTLLEYILTADHGYKIAVCMNDFGDTTDIESSALTLTDPLTGTQSTEFLSLPNGCLCCSFKDMGMAAVEEMAHKQGVDWVMVELTGLADPGPIAKGFWENEEMGDLVLDGVVCVVDCRNVLRQLADLPQEGGTSNEAQRQIACADVLLLNKTDLVEKHQISEVEQAIKSINPTTRIHQTQQSRIPLDAMFNIRSFSDTSLDTDEAKTWRAETATATATAAEHRHAHAHGADCSSACADANHAPSGTEQAGARSSSLHDSSITSTLIPLPPLPAAAFNKLNDFLETVLWTDKVPGDPTGSLLSASGVEVLRIKGLIRRDDGREYVLQGVTDIFELKEMQRGGGKGGESEQVHVQVQGKIVFIGRKVDLLGEKLREHLRL